ncbi:MAG TPA: alpha-glucuronidase family glycosyl hydrolase [Chitinophagaceae bacterium]|nr:alpha-glucuronidase family glycosyl hydrolase [Chitinophagaceae bacterium]
MRKRLMLIFILLPALLKAEDGYDLWLRYKKISNNSLLDQYKKQITSPVVFGSSQTITIIKAELSKAFSGLISTSYKILSSTDKSSSFIAGTLSSSTIISSIVTKDELNLIGSEGFIIKTKPGKTIITANTDIGVLYGVFHFLRLMQTQQPISNLNIISAPKIKMRILNHWDNLNRTVERGYAGFSIWDWHKLPDFIDKRYIDYARANASIGINSTVLTNVNANAVVLTKPYLEKVKALADLFRPYGIKVYLTARFSAPIELGKLKTADPLNDTVQLWWKQKVKEVYELIPDFGGFLVKANSEGQPGPQDYSRTHADGANMLADAVAPFNGIIMWRAFVYSSTSNDRFKQAYEEFKPLDGKFRKNVLVQVKNGPIDFQPREPFSPLFGAMQQTPLMMEFQLTQEYLGQGTNLVFEAPLFKEVLNADTYAKGKGSTVTKMIDGSLNNFSLNGIAGVSNIGNDINWCSHPFAQANWYALGRLCWDYELSSAQIADEWIRQSFTNDPSFVEPVKKIMLQSRETLVNYMTPIGLTHIMYNGHHYGPMPWGNTLGRPDWNPVYYHKADSFGIGFDRTAKGTNALAQYAIEVQKEFNDINKCPDEYLLWFHHVAWDHKMHSGRTLWEELCYKYNSGVDSVRSFIKQWNGLMKYIDEDRFKQVDQLLNIQLKDAIWWRNACLLYFQTFSKMPIPAQYEKPDKTLEYYQNIRILYAPGN